MNNPYLGSLGSDFDEFLQEEGIHGEVTASALKRVIARQLKGVMESKHITKTEIAARLDPIDALRHE